MACLATSSTALAFLSNMSEKCKSASLNAIQVRNRQKTISIEGKLDLISWLEEGEQIFDIGHNVNLLIVACVQFVILLVELKNMKEGAKSETKVLL